MVARLAPALVFLRIALSANHVARSQLDPAGELGILEWCVRGQALLHACRLVRHVS